MTFNTCFNVAQVVTSVRILMWQRALLFKRLEVTEAMRVFFTWRLDGNEKLRT